MLYVIWFMLYVICFMLYAIWYLLDVICCMLYGICYMLYVICFYVMATYTNYFSQKAVHSATMFEYTI